MGKLKAGRKERASSRKAEAARKNGRMPRDDEKFVVVHQQHYEAQDEL